MFIKVCLLLPWKCWQMWITLLKVNLYSLLFFLLQVCKYYLCGFCPHELFVNTRADLGKLPLPYNISTAVLITHNAHLIAIFLAGNYRFEAQNNDCHLKHLFQVLINLHGRKSTWKHSLPFVLWFLKTDSMYSSVLEIGYVLVRCKTLNCFCYCEYHDDQLAIWQAEYSGRVRP